MISPGYNLRPDGEGTETRRFRLGYYRRHVVTTYDPMVRVLKHLGEESAVYIEDWLQPTTRW